MIETFKQRDDWMRALLRTDLPPVAKNVGTRLALYLNVETGRLDPLQFSLAKELGTTERNVRRGIAALVEAGWIAKTRRGLKRSDSYSLKRPRPDESVRSRPDKNGKSDRTNSSSITANRTADRDGGTLRAPNGAQGKGKKEGSAKPTVVGDGTLSRAFDWLWQEYDRGHFDNPEPARQAFMAACAAGDDPEAILRGAKNYMDGKEPCYRKKLEDWLGKRGWTKPPPKPKPASFTQKVDPGKNMQGLAERLRAERLAREAAGK